MPPILIMTRPLEASRAFTAALGDAATRVVISPAFRVVPFAADPLAQVPDAVVFTSAEAVRQAARLALPKGLPAWCVGPQTAAAARAAGHAATDAGGDAEALVATLIAAQPQGQLLHPRGRHSRGAVAERLQAAGIACVSRVIYEQQPQAPDAALVAAAAGNDPLLCPVFSPRSAQIFAGLPAAAPRHGIAISPAVADALTDLHFDRVAIAERPDRAAMIALTARFLREISGRSLT